MLGRRTSLNDVIRPRQYRGRDREAEGRSRTPENLVHVDGSAPPSILVVWVVAHQTAGLHEEPSLAHSRQPVRNGQFGDALSRGDQGWGAEYEHGVPAAAGHGPAGARPLSPGLRAEALQQ